MRFPGFEAELNSYKKYLFKDIFLFSIGKNIKQSEASPKFETPCVRYGELYHLYNEVITEVFNKTNLNKSELLFSDGDEILLPSAGEDPLDIGSASALTVKNVAIGRTINILKPVKADIYSQAYVSYYINQRLKKVISTLAKGVSISNVYNSDLRTLEITLPGISEQQKIVSFLTLIDQRIATQNKILQHYQSLIQNLREAIFKQKIRFKDSDGSPFPIWKICKLKDIAERVVRKNSDNNQNVLTISAQHGLISQLDFFNKSVSAKNVEGYFLLKKGDFAYNKSYSTGYPMGAIKRLNIYNQGIVSTLYICFRFNEKVKPDFMEHYFESQIQNNELEKIAQEGARNHGLLNVGVLDFFNIQTQLPSFDEQVEIANLFSALDKRVNIEKDVLDKLKRQKNYLLQNLLT